MGRRCFMIDVFDYVNEEEDVEEYGQCLYLNVSNLTNDILKVFKKHPTYKDYRVEIVGSSIRVMYE